MAQKEKDFVKRAKTAGSFGAAAEQEASNLVRLLILVVYYIYFIFISYFSSRRNANMLTYSHLGIFGESNVVREEI